MTDEISLIKTFFDSYQVHLSPIWLTDCVRWCKEEALPNNYTIKDLKYKVYEQWLLLDLRDVEVPCLPPNLSSKQKYILNGNYSLQLMKVVDISKPKYWQIQRIRNESCKNVEKDETVNSKRVLMLTLSDGVQEIEAMELTSIKILNVNLTPGIKIRIMGPVTIRRGILMLEDKNVKVLGGEVDTLMVSNAAENILATSLNLPLNPNPFIIQESMLTADTDILQETNHGYEPKQENISFKNEQSNVKQQSLKQSIPSHVQNRILNNQPDPQTLLDEEESKINEEIDNLMEIERDFEESKLNKTNRTLQQTPDMFEQMDIDDAVLANIDIPKTPTRIINVTNSNTQKNRLVNIAKKDIPSMNDDEDEIFEHFDLDSHLDKLDEKIAQNMPNKDIGELSSSLNDNPAFKNFECNPHLDTLDEKIEQNIFKKQNVETYQPSVIKKLKLDSEDKPIHNTAKSTVSQPIINIWTINKLKQHIDKITNGKFKIKAKFKTVVEKLTLIEQQFHLVINVEDGSDDVTVRIQSDVVAQWAGCTAVQLNSLKSSLPEKINEAQCDILKILQTLRENLQKLDNIVELLVSSKEQYPVLLKILS